MRSTRSNRVGFRRAAPTALRFRSISEESQKIPCGGTCVRVVWERTSPQVMRPATGAGDVGWYRCGGQAGCGARRAGRGRSRRAGRRRHGGGPQPSARDVGEHRRFFTGATRRAVQVRDGECFHPYCDTPAADCDIDHTQPWTAGGLTTQDNGRPACGFHCDQPGPAQATVIHARGGNLRRVGRAPRPAGP